MDDGGSIPSLFMGGQCGRYLQFIRGYTRFKRGLRTNGKTNEIRGYGRWYEFIATVLY